MRIGLLTKNFIKNVLCTGNPEAHKSRLISLDDRIFVKKHEMLQLTSENEE